MSQVIVIDSSEDEVNIEPEAKEAVPANVPMLGKDDIVLPKSETPSAENLFSTFCNLCKELVKDNEKGSKILKFLHRKHELAPTDFKSSRTYRKILESCISKLGKGSKDVYVHVHNVISTLDKNCAKRVGLQSDDQGVGGKKRRISLQAHPPEPTSNDQDSAKENGMASSYMSKDCDSEPAGETSSSIRILEEERRHRKIKRLEVLLKKISQEIIRLQSEELSLSQMDEDNTSYIQESKLKKRFMQVYNELCKLNKSSSSTGRVIEKKIRVTASRFSEVNRKVERFINNPKRDCVLPDFSDIFHLVKQASIKNQLHLQDRDIQTVSRQVFEEVGEKMQKRRQQDFGFEFGCSLVDEQQKDSDPALADSILKEKLVKNRSEARKNMESVINKFSAMQQSIKESDPNDPALQEDSETKESDDDESSDDNVEFVSSDLVNFKVGENNNSEKVQCNIDGNRNLSGFEESKLDSKDSKSGLFLQSLKLDAKSESV